MTQEATQVGRIVIPTEKIPKPGGPSSLETQKHERESTRWHGVALLYARVINERVELRLFYEGHIPQEMKNEIAQRFGVGAVEWSMEC